MFHSPKTANRNHNAMNGLSYSVGAARLAIMPSRYAIALNRSVTMLMSRLHDCVDTR